MRVLLFLSNVHTRGYKYSLIEDDMARVVIDPNPDWKKKLAAVMKELGVIPTANFGGKMEIDWNDGGITAVKLPVTLK